MIKRPIQVKHIRDACKGYRVLITKNQPQAHSHRKFFDAWIPELAPNIEIYQWCQDKKITWDDFKNQYLHDLNSADSQDLLKPIALLSLRRVVILLCDCEDKNNCRTKILADSLEQCCHAGNFVLNNFGLRPRKERLPMTIIEFLIADHDRLRRQNRI